MLLVLATTLASSVVHAQGASNGPPPSGGGSGGGATGGGPPGGASGGGSSMGGPPMVPPPVDPDNKRFADYNLVVLGCLALAVILYRTVLRGAHYLRTVACLNNPTQTYFATPTPWVASLKRHVLYAPLFRARHSREMRITRGWSVGILPTRLQSMLFAAIIAMNVAFCATNIDWRHAGTPDMLTQFRNRLGAMAVVNLVPLVLAAGRNNPLLGPTGVSYDTFNLVHRWFGRLCAALGVSHGIVHMTKAVTMGGWKSFGMSLSPAHGLTIVTGFIVSERAG